MFGHFTDFNEHPTPESGIGQLQSLREICGTISSTLNEIFMDMHHTYGQRERVTL